MKQKKVKDENKYNHKEDRAQESEVEENSRVEEEQAEEE